MRGSVDDHKIYDIVYYYNLESVQYTLTAHVSYISGNNSKAKTIFTVCKVIEKTVN